MHYRIACLLISWLLFAPDSFRAQQQDRHGGQQRVYDAAGEVVSIETSLVVLNVTITDGKDRSVAGLAVTDFRVFENQAQQRIASFSFDEMPFAAVILLDTSVSMMNKMGLAQAACARFVTGVREGDSVAIYGFGGTTVRLLRDFAGAQEGADPLRDVRAEGNTPLYDGLIAAANALAKRPERRRAIVLISDGADTKSRATLADAARKVIAAGIAVYSVDLSDSAVYGISQRDNGAEVLKALSAKTGGRYFSVPGGNKLRDAFTRTVDELRNQYTITYEPTNDRHDGRWRAIEVLITRPKLKVRTRQGYFAHQARG